MPASDGRRDPVTAAELKRRLAEDPAFEARRLASEAKASRRAARLAEAEQPLLRDLAALGVDVPSVWSLCLAQPYPAGVFDVLLRHLDNPLPDRVREGIARAFATTDAVPYWNALADRYRREASPLNAGVRQGLAAALATLAHKNVRDELVGLLQDRRLGGSRVLLLRALTRLRLPDRWTLIAALADDPDLRAEAEHMLRSRARRMVPSRRE